MKRPVYLRGMAAACAAGDDRATIADACIAALPAPAEVCFRSLGGDVVLPYFRAGGIGTATPRVAEQALDDAVRRDALALYFGSSSAGITLHERAYVAALAAGSDGDAPHGGPLFPIHAPDQSRAARELRTALGARGPYYTLNTACSSAANALLYAAFALRDGLVDAALAVGIEEENRLSQQGFFSLMLATRERSRPFDVARDGIVLGEGAAALHLSADRGGARWQLLGGASLCDASHPTNPSAERIADTIHAALDDAGVAAAEVSAVKAHGTGTRANDQAEALGLRRVFGDAMPPLTSIKPVLGHTLGACGALETVAFTACLERGRVPPTAGFADADPELGVAPLRAAAPWRGGVALLNYFGFGGNNCALLLRELA
ncbi:beta-ketoacyl synthase N-terminal-like domain-containing protein [Solimonas soli]|uniref:beta-ketoacyl synthase N-terminal-like domain-containing protein n=1 Tax=Solimonas soli TaxID=413479 RepID=UPI0004BADA34|nr:beta-ketoacyl synthase N-terminal-like domain-containing protein [Solimonas soli]